MAFGNYPMGAPYAPAPGYGVFETTSPITSIFASNNVLSGEYGNLQSLNSTLEPAGTVLSTPVLFMTFSGTGISPNPNVHYGGTNLELFLTEVFQGNLPSPPPSPFVLHDTPDGNATAAVDFMGYILNTTDNSKTPYSGLFSATFAGSTVAQLLTSLPVDTAFSGTLTLTSTTATPEPASLLLMGIGLLGAGVVARKKVRN
ncbi:MAG: PEP-CTERM sorting domain-containing protein [Acidobacteriota bacterium]|nr:PEP-CTERM sorting domain-containing protein [Acidobacteriota bacterium]